ncbi:CG0192-related protein [Brevibacterium luteolum]|uniref:Maltokinase N-terminal cap domain-containing protein n=1 Tax=Brevibacterium luteolum TaxID=199591 RepID=A0A2N6PJJ8_9MICO|nr:hypothetical protein [Brevibacterium luteolum]PMB98870.1 hypothetical protein CJ198_06135 [Brevibacterium luteolum]
MAQLYDAELSPGKLELVQTWLPSQEWSGLDAEVPLEVVTSYRFDDPAGEVGIEMHLVRSADDADGPVYQVPVTYRGAPLEGAEDALITTMEHSVLGKRWVYDAVADPVFVEQARRTIAEADTSAEEIIVDGDNPGPRTDIADARGTGWDAAIKAVEEADLNVTRLLGADQLSGAETGPGMLMATWDGQSEPVELMRLV